MTAPLDESQGLAFPTLFPGFMESRHEELLPRPSQQIHSVRARPHGLVCDATGKNVIAQRHEHLTGVREDGIR